MVMFDQLNKKDPRLRLLVIGMLSGMVILLIGLWWVQIVSMRDYQANLQTQSFRTVRIPAVRGKILDCNGKPLAENRPTFNVSLYLEEMRKLFDDTYTDLVRAARANRERQAQVRRGELGRDLTKEEAKAFVLSRKDKEALRQQAKCIAASNAVAAVSARLRQPIQFDPTNYQRHYETRLALPYPVLRNLDATNIARFQEQGGAQPGIDIEIQSTRIYPYGMTAAHVLGQLTSDNSSFSGEEAFFSFRLPDYRGLVGIEAGYDRELRGRAGAKSVLVNNIGYRQTENIWTPAEAGQNVRLTIDLSIQQAAERALPVLGPETRGAAVVMEVETGNLLALVSCPAHNPNHFVQGFPPGEQERLRDPKLRPQINRATQMNYAPGSVFKPLIGLAALEAGLNPRTKYHTDGYVMVGKRRIDDLVEPGFYDFKRALIKSSNAYFISNGLRAGMPNILKLAQRVRLGERVGLPTRQEVSGSFPSARRIQVGWTDGDTANICIGQGAMDVTPLQMAVMTAAIANGGKVLRPRLVDRIEPDDPTDSRAPVVFPVGSVRDNLGVKPQNLETLREAMLADVEDAEGTGQRAAVPGMRICGKTGTAQVTDHRNVVIDHTTWFISFAPFEAPKYAVVVMVESGVWGGTTCAPIAKQIYLALQEREGRLNRPTPPLAMNH